VQYGYDKYGKYDDKYGKYDDKYGKVRRENVCGLRFVGWGE
jgi:hypothetical protein